MYGPVGTLPSYVFVGRTHTHTHTSVDSKSVEEGKPQRKFTVILGNGQFIPRNLDDTGEDDGDDDD